MSKRILLLGVGNILYGDEGIGVHAAWHLQKNYSFSDNVNLVEGGVLGKLLMSEFLECDIAIIMDAVLGGDEPGSIYRLLDTDLRKSLGFRDSQHQVDLVDILISCDLIGKRPETIVIGIEPFDWQNLRTEITPELQKYFDRFIEIVCEEVKKQGGSVHLKNS